MNALNRAEKNTHKRREVKVFLVSNMRVIFCGKTLTIINIQGHFGINQVSHHFDIAGQNRKTEKKAEKTEK